MNKENDMVFVFRKILFSLGVSKRYLMGYIWFVSFFLYSFIGIRLCSFIYILFIIVLSLYR